MRYAAALTVLAVALGSTGCSGTSGPERRLFRDVAEVRALPAEHLRLGHPVRFSGYVVHWAEGSRTLIVSDGRTAILVDPLQPGEEWNRGAKVRVEGYTGYDNFAPVVVKARVTVRDPSTWEPAPVRIEAGDVRSGRYEHQWIQLRGRLDSVASGAMDKTRVVFASGGSSVGGIVLRDTVGVLNRIAGREVVVRGIPMVRRSPDGRSDDVELHVDSGYDIVPLTGLRPPVERSLARPDRRLRTLTTVRAVKALTPSEAARRYPVRLSAVVTSFQAARGIFTVHDGSDGLYVFPESLLARGLRVGDLVEITGSTDPADFSAAVVPVAIARLGPGQLPEPQPLDPGVLTPTLDNQWVQGEGVVRSVYTNVFGHPVLRVASGHSLFDAEVLSREAAVRAKETVDSRVALTGVWSPVANSWRQLRGFRMYVPLADNVRVIDRIEPPAEAVSVADLRAFHAGNDEFRRVRVRGVVTAARMTGELWVQDAGAGAEVDLLPPAGDKSLPAGTPVEVTGLLRLGGGSARLYQARVYGAPRTNTPLPPAFVSGDECTTGDVDARLVRLQGYVLNVYQSLGDTVISMRSGRAVFRSVLENPSISAIPASVRAGALVELTGVCRVRWNQERQPPRAERAELVLRSPDDVRIVVPASWWTRDRTMTLLVTVTVISLAVTFWALLLHRRLRRQRAALQVQMRREAELQAQLEEARRLESIGQLAGGLAHDFNNSLTVILGYADMLRHAAPDDELVTDSVTQILNAGTKAASLTRQLLAYSRRQALQPQVVDLNHQIRESLPLLKRATDESIRVELRLARELPCIKVDPGQLHQVLINLVANARDAMPGGGLLTIETATTWGGFVRLAVSDTGVGMDAATQARIFEPFFTTKGLAKGTGLGLATVYGIVKQSGGQIQVESRPGAGSTFTIEFPATSEPLPDSAGVPGGRARGEGHRILVVEDRDDVRRLAAQMLTDGGYVVIEAPSGEAALRKAASGEAQCDLLLSDVVLPGMGGPDVAAELMAAQPGIRVMFMSGYAENLVSLQDRFGDKVRLLAKPFTREELLAAVEEALRERAVRQMAS